MTTDFAEKERQFLDSLKAASGRDLAEWMAAIEAEGLPHRNDIIDWLRQQGGFPFARASWLERVHANGGRPLYEGSSEADARAAPKRTRRTARVPSASPPERAGSATVIPFKTRAGAPPASAPALPASPPSSAALDELLAKAKAYRPLALFVLREIEKAVPGACSSPHAAHVSIGAPAEFAVLAIGSRELRLGLDLGPLPFEGSFQKAKFGSALPIAPAITHMTILTDARQVDADLVRHIRSAASRAIGR